jgi:hypothetical protein
VGLGWPGLAQGAGVQVRITRLTHAKPVIKFGVLKGKVKLAADFDAPLPSEVLAGFEGR